jgi:uncharacterized caspase-like protein
MPFATIIRTLFVFALLLGWAGQAEARRVALVIANAQYSNATSLKNPGADARLVSQSLKQAGFDYVDVQYDLDKLALETKLREFGNRADGADVALIYYAGHGIEAGGQNFLIPVDAKLVRDRDLEIEATRLDTALLMLEGGQLKILVLDACRNNPFAASMQRTLRNRAIGRGLAAFEPEGETLVVYAAKAGSTAADGVGANSPFAEALAARLPQPGLEISLLFRNVRDDVLRKTGGSQEPFTYGSLSGNAFYFVGGQPTVNVGVAAAPQQSVSVSSETGEALFWQGTVNANSENAYRSYLEQYPAGRFAALARENIARINAPPAQLPGISGFTVPAFTNVIGPNAVGGGTANLDQQVLRSFAFTPSASIRQQSIKDFLAQMEASTPGSGAVFGAVFQSQDMFALLQREALDEYGMSINNLADAFSVMVGTLHDGANGQVTDITRAQAQGLRNQMAKLLLLTPDQIPADDAGKQKLSDQLLLASLILAFSLEQAQSDPATMRQISDDLHRQTVQMMQVDFRTLKISDAGLVAR